MTVFMLCFSYCRISLRVDSRCLLVCLCVCHTLASVQKPTARVSIAGFVNCTVYKTCALQTDACVRIA